MRISTGQRSHIQWQTGWSWQSYRMPFFFFFFWPSKCVLQLKIVLGPCSIQVPAMHVFFVSAQQTLSKLGCHRLYSACYFHIQLHSCCSKCPGALSIMWLTLHLFVSATLENGRRPYPKTITRVGSKTRCWPTLLTPSRWEDSTIRLQVLNHFFSKMNESHAASGSKLCTSCKMLLKSCSFVSVTSAGGRVIVGCEKIQMV